MNVDKAMEIIYQIASKLGVAAEYIIPELARMQIAQTAMLLVLSIVFSVVLSITIKKVQANNPEDKDDIDYGGTAITMFAAVAFVISLVVIASSACELSGWLASPTAKSIEYVMRALK